MATIKKGKKSQKSQKSARTTTAKTSKKSAPKASSNGAAKKHDEYVIRRLVKENPRRAGSEKAKIWDRLKKGMTVAEFCTKGGTRAAVERYVENGWIKLLRPKGGDE